MAWTDKIDAYCERTDFTYWSEPVNAVTNAAFLLAAVLMWRRTEGIVMARVLCVILFVIGIGSFLFHTHATQWASTADVVPIGLFILTYLFLVNRDVLGLHWGWALLGTVLFVPYAAALVPLLNGVPFVRISNFYWTVPILLLLYAVYLRGRLPQVARGFAIGAGLLMVSITIRSLDQSLCDDLPLGTHFGWHILNAVMLGWMIEVYRRHMLARAGARG